MFETSTSHEYVMTETILAATAVRTEASSSPEYVMTETILATTAVRTENECFSLCFSQSLIQISDENALGFLT